MQVSDLERVVDIPKPTPKEMSYLELVMSKGCPYKTAALSDENGKVKIILENKIKDWKTPHRLHIIADANGIRVRASAKAGTRDPYWYRKDGEWIESQYALGLEADEKAVEEVIPLPDNFVTRKFGKDEA